MLELVNAEGSGDGSLKGDLCSGIRRVRPMTLTCCRSGWSQGRTGVGREGGGEGNLEVEMLMEGDALTFVEEVDDAFCLEGILDLELV
jgi:hypothetical protein